MREELSSRLTEKEQKVVSEYFNITVEELQKIWQEGDLAIFTDLQRFMYWYLDERDSHTLIDYIIDKEDPYPSDQCCKLEDKRIVFLYM